MVDEIRHLLVFKSAGGRRRAYDQNPLPRVHDKNSEATWKQHSDSERLSRSTKILAERALPIAEDERDELSNVSSSTPSGTQ